MFVAIGRADRQARFDDAALLLGEELKPGGMYRLLAENGDQRFGDDYFEDLFIRSRLGRPIVPARVVATVMLLQAFDGLSDQEACDRLAFDLRWKAAAGLSVGSGSFHPTVLVGMRNRLRAGDRPRRLFEDVNTVARAAGLLRGRRRVLDSTPLLDAVATQDTVTQLRAAIRTLLAAAEAAGERDLLGAAALEVFGDSAYPDGATLDKLAAAGHEVHAKVPPARNAKGYSKDEFTIDTQAGTVGCPAGHTAQIRPRRHGGQARFRPWCAGCPLRAACTTPRSGRVITIHPHEAHLQQAKTAQRDPAWQHAYRATRPTAERKIAHLTRRQWGGRRARCRGSRPLSWPGSDPHRRPHPRRRDQPRQPRWPRSPIHPGRVGHRLSGPPRPLPTPLRPPHTSHHRALSDRNAPPNRTHEPGRAQPRRSPTSTAPGRSP